MVDPCQAVVVAVAVAAAEVAVEMHVCDANDRLNGIMRMVIVAAMMMNEAFVAQLIPHLIVNY